MYQTNNYPSNQQQMTLPFDPGNITGQMLHIQPGQQPPFVPQVNCSQAMMRYAPLVTSFLILEIQGRVQDMSRINPLRIFMFNQYSVNGYYNNEFTELVTNTLNYIEFLLMTGSVNNEDQAIQRAVIEITQNTAASLLIFYPPIQAYLQPNQIQDAQQGYQTMRAIVAQIQQFNTRRQFQQPNQMQQYSMHQNAGYQNPNMGGYQVPVNRVALSTNSGGFVNGNQNQFRNTFDDSSQFSELNTAGKRAISEANRYTNQLQRQRGSATQVPQSDFQPNHAAYGRFTTPVTKEEVLHQPFESKNHKGFNQDAIVGQISSDQRMTFDQAVQKNSPSKPTQSIAIVNQQKHTPQYYRFEDLKWMPTEEQPCLPAYNPKTHKLLLTHSEKTKAVVAVLVTKNESDDQMDYEKHCFGRAPKTRLVKDEALPQVIEEIKNYAEPNIDCNVQVVKALIHEPCLEMAIVNAGVKSWLSGFLKQTNSAYRFQNVIAEPLVCDNNELAAKYRQTIKDIVATGNFKDAIAILKELNGEEDLLLVNKINERMTVELLRAVRVNLSLKIGFDSFIDDAMEVDEVIRKKSGNQIANALKEQESAILSRALGTLDDEETKDFTQFITNEEIIIGEEEKTPNATFVYLTQYISITHLSLNMYELNLAVVNKEAAMLTESESPILFAMAGDVYEDSEIKKYDFARHYFITKDGVRFEITRGFLNKNSFIISMN